MRPHPRRARTDPTSPRAWATSDRSGFIGNQEDLRWQFEYRGTQLINTRILVYEDEYDEPQRQLGTLIIPPDPVSILNARPEQYPIDEYAQIMFEMPNVGAIPEGYMGGGYAGRQPGTTLKQPATTGFYAEGSTVGNAVQLALEVQQYYDTTFTPIGPFTPGPVQPPLLTVYVAPDGSTHYVAEDGSTVYIVEP